MYLPEYREQSLKDLITLLEPELFQRVTGLSGKDFELLCSLGVFNASLAYYFDQGYRFSRTPDAGATGQTVILINGWGVQAYSMQELAEALAKKGFDARNYDYHSSECCITLHVEIFLVHLRKLVKELPQNEKIHILTQSMGGLILRGALARMTSYECQRISSIVMLGPPNKGSLLAYFGAIPTVRKWNASLGDMTPEATSYAMTIPEPAWLPPTGIIAGKNDGKVAVEDTHLPEPLHHEHIVVDCSHPGPRSPVKVLKHILKFFRSAPFKDTVIGC